METRDVRLTERQLFHAKRAVGDRVKVLERRLAKTSYASKPGMLDAALDELSELRELYADLSHNLRQMTRSGYTIASDEGVVIAEVRHVQT